MGRLSGTALRERAKRQGIVVSWEQFKTYEAWGLIPERPEGGWSEVDIERLRQIRDVKAKTRSLHRRVILLQDARWPIRPKHLRQAMIDTIPSIETPPTKMRALYRALKVRYGDVPVAKVAKIRVPTSWRVPPRPAWEDAFRWPNDEEFSLIFGPVWSDTQSLVWSPQVVNSRLLEEIPLEEIVILLMTHQLTLPSQSFPSAASDGDGEGAGQ